ncbi:hypothetical protein MIR68_004467 [Amoeboaphelidium protococcarum]|nr:hypothetical protein MIR68_004467 [Amoeboaphelidium protococcarum]
MSQHITEQDQQRRDQLVQPMPIINESVNDAEGEEVKQELDQALHQFYSTSQGTLPSLYPRNDRLPRYGAQNINGQAQLPKSPRRLQVPAAAGSVNDSRRSSAASQTPQYPSKLSGDQAVIKSHSLQGDLQQQANKTEEQQQIIDWRDDIVVDASHVDPYLQAVASISFNLNVFIFEFLSHLLLPLTFIFNIWTVKGRLYLANRSLLSHKDPGFWIQWISMASLIYIHVLYFAFRPKDFYLVELMLCNVLWLIRFAVISTKYAYVSSVEYKEMSLNVETAMQKSERQVITGWRSPSSHLIETQILLASVRQRVDLTQSSFLILQEEEDGSSNHIIYLLKMQGNKNQEKTKRKDKAEKHIRKVLKGRKIKHADRHVVKEMVKRRLQFSSDDIKVYYVYLELLEKKTLAIEESKKQGDKFGWRRLKKVFNSTKDLKTTVQELLQTQK